MSTSQKGLRPQELKQPRTIQLRLLVPYALFVAAVIFFTGCLNGWVLRSDMNSKIDAEVSARFEQVKK